MELMNIGFLKAIGITLFHSIWQATLIALLMSLILSVIKKEKAKERYLVSISALLILLLTSVATFWRVYQPDQFSMLVIEEEKAANIYDNIIVIAHDQALLARLKDAVVQNIEWFTLMWVVGMLFFTMKIILGMHFTNSLGAASREIRSFETWKLFENLKKKAGYLLFVDLRESIKVKTPSVIGIMKPCIYFPIGLINNLSVAEVESILAHELAHIIRNDFLVNILQSIVETFFYFHPAVWWISANIRNERENACDDLAIAIVGDKIKYARSLLLLQEWEVNAKAGLAMTLSSKETPLFGRIKRILSQPKNKHDMKQKIFASVILMSSIIWISATDASSTVEVPKNTGIEQPFVSAAAIDDYHLATTAISLTDTIPVKSEKKQSAIVEIENGKIKRLEIDGEEIPESEFEQHQEIFGDLGGERDIFADKIIYHFQDSLRGLEHSLEADERFFERLDKMNLEGDSLWPYLEGTLERARGLDKEFYYNFEGQIKNIDSISKHFEFFHEDHGQFLNLDSIASQLRLLQDEQKFENEYLHRYQDTMRFNMDSLRSKMDEMRFHFDDIGNEIRIFADSFNFPEIKNDVFLFLDSIDFDGIGDAIRHSFDSLDFPEFDYDFHNERGDFLHGNNLERSFLEEMKKDDLYQDSGNEIRLSYDELEINGKPQPASTHKRYKSIYESKTGIELLKGSNLQIKIDNSSTRDSSRKRNLRKF